MIDLQFNIAAFEHRAQEIGATLDQLPFAISSAMNESAKVTRRTLVEQTWPTAMKVRNRSFIGRALRTDYASKSKLSVSIFDSLGRAGLARHAMGGIKQGKGKLAIPTARVVRGASGVRQSQKPRNLKRAVVKGNLIFQAEGRGKGSKLRLMYKLTPSAQIKKDVPFFETFRAQMRQEMELAVPLAMLRAMATRKR